MFIRRFFPLTATVATAYVAMAELYVGIEPAIICSILPLLCL